MSQPLDPQLMSTTAVGQIFMQQIPADNVVMKFILNFIILAVLSGVSSQYQSVIQWIKDVWAKLRAHSEKRPELRFTARESLTSYSSGLTASNEFKAWLGRIRDIIKSAKHSELLKLSEFRERSYYYDETEGGKETTSWLPSQAEAFQLTDKIWAQFHSDDISEGDGEKTKSSHREYTLTIYVKDVNQRKFLINYHDSLMEEFHAASKLTLNSQPHIFELKGAEEDDSELKWSMYPFSSTRRMDHVWFKEKEIFETTYNYFLNNKAEYERRGDPWTFSCLLHGLPGCGKTSLLKAVVNDAVKRGEMAHIFIIPFSKISNADQLSRIIFDQRVNGHTIPLSQRILVFEDFDANGSSKIFAKRDNLGDPSRSTTGKSMSVDVDTTGFGSEDLASMDKEELIKKMGDFMIGPKQKNTSLSLSAVLETPLHIVARLYGTASEMYTLLMMYGANDCVKDSQGRTPSSYASAPLDGSKAE